MAVTAGWFPITLKNLFDGTIALINWETETIKCSLHMTYSQDPDNHDFFNDASGSELATAGGYTAGGLTLTTGGSSVTFDTASDEVRLDATDASWSSATFSATDAVIWKDTAGASSTDPLIVWIDFGATETVASGTFTIAFASNGVAVIDCT